MVIGKMIYLYLSLSLFLVFLFSDLEKKMKDHFIFGQTREFDILYNDMSL